MGALDDDGKPYGDYVDVLQGAFYMYPIRTILRASPGYVLVEADLQGAELAVLAWLSGDTVMADHVERNKLPEGDPNHYDIHSRMAVEAFQLSCPPTKTGLKQAGRKGLRVAAKNVIFGIPYGRQAPAIARQCREEGVNIDVDDTQKLIDMYFTKYPNTIEFIKECQRRAENPRWLTTAFLRIRRFMHTTDKAVLGEQQRQAQNAPIQGSVADAISRACDNLWCYRERDRLMSSDPVDFKMLLQIHDAILFEVRVAHLRRFIEEVLPECMVRGVPVLPRRLDGTLPAGAQPHYFGIDVTTYSNWGEKIDEATAKQLEIDLALI